MVASIRANSQLRPGKTIHGKGVAAHGAEEQGHRRMRHRHKHAVEEVAPEGDDRQHVLVVGDQIVARQEVRRPTVDLLRALGGQHKHPDRRETPTETRPKSSSALNRTSFDRGPPATAGRSRRMSWRSCRRVRSCQVQSWRLSLCFRPAAAKDANVEHRNDDDDGRHDVGHGRRVAEMGKLEARCCTDTRAVVRPALLAPPVTPTSM